MNKSKLYKLGIIASVLVAVGLYYTQPWRAFTSSTLNEPLVSTASAESTASSNADMKDFKILKTGTFQSLAHEASGKATIYQLPNGKKILRIENLSISDGPDLKVVLSPLSANLDKLEGKPYTSLGSLKATQGNFNYDLPDDLDVHNIHSLAIWCQRFDVSFGAVVFN